MGGMCIWISVFKDDEKFYCSTGCALSTEIDCKDCAVLSHFYRVALQGTRKVEIQTTRLRKSGASRTQGTAVNVCVLLARSKGISTRPPSGESVHQALRLTAYHIVIVVFARLNLRRYLSNDQLTWIVINVCFVRRVGRKSVT